MWWPRCCPRENVERRKAGPVVLKSAGRNYTASRSTYRVWNDDPQLKGYGLWDDVLFQRHHAGDGWSGAKGGVGCERNCGESFNPAQGSMGATTCNSENTTQRTYIIELKPSTTTRTMGTNTVTYYEKEDHEVPVSVLKEENNIIEEELHNKVASTSPRVKLPISTPRVALLQLPKPNHHQHLNKLAQKMIKSKLQTPQLWIRSPQSLTSQKTTPQTESHPHTQTLMGQEKLASRLLTTPPTEINTPRSHYQDPVPQPEPINPVQPLNLSLRETLIHVSNQSSRKSSKVPLEEASESDSLVTTASEGSGSSRSSSEEEEEASVESFNNDGDEEIPSTPCLCSLCGRCESVADSSRMNSVAVYRNNPFYSPLARAKGPSPGAGLCWRFFYTLVEVLVLLALGAALTLGLIPYVESVFRAYMADYCRCSGKGAGTAGAGPELMADRVHSGAAKWFTCMMDDRRAASTPAM